MVPVLTPNSRARSLSLGMAEPGFHSPPAMRSASASRSCKYSGRFKNRLGHDPIAHVCLLFHAKRPHIGLGASEDC